ncbi:hypothetical protein [Candidatus Uabimicrobium amorphum]|uniref:Uncharacterized protein n=1 Tax=Uabimicrobium amorphum TaxID=2596890 RepID=A0A5S9INR0_UABAM|nr:hypothetical protein [Candidatus Uabimicrobium amorphum]BBM83925.1 hypothetical protein UABAM_02280 [Candidatus Uabimicrobium amorphum]
MRNKTKIIIGCVAWGVCFSTFLAVWILIPQDTWQSSTSWIEKQQRRHFSLPFKLKVIFDDWIALRAGDKVYTIEKDERIEIGAVYAKDYSEKNMVWNLYINIYPEHKSKIGSDSKFYLESEHGTPAWVVSKLLPEQRREDIKDIIDEYLRIHTEEIQKQLLPIFTEVAQESYTLLQKNFSVIMEKNKDELLKRLQEAEKKHIDKELQKLWDDVVWPIVLEESDPVIAPIVQKLWGKFPKAKIVMLWIYQSLPGTDNDHVQKKVEDYLQDKAIPIVEEHKEELGKLLVTITNRLSKEKKVKASFLKMLKNVFTDEALLKILKNTMIELYKINRDTLTEKLKKKWSDPQVRNSLAEISDNFEPYLIKMINHILIDEERQIRPELAQVLRRQILYKDKYFLMATMGHNAIDTSSPLEFRGSNE